jgi:hypothetical protein
MSTTATPPTSGRGAVPTEAGDPRIGSRMWRSRLIGGLAGFVIYGTGSVLVTSVVDGPDFLAGVGGQKTTLALGPLLRR